MTIKISRNKLRRLINEAIQGREPGAPLWSPQQDQVKDDLAQKLVDVATKHWDEMYSDDDPTMATAGHDAWNMQVSSAVDEFAEGVVELLERVESRLVNGEYFSG